VEVVRRSKRRSRTVNMVCCLCFCCWFDADGAECERVLCCVVCGVRRNLFGWFLGCVEGKGVTVEIIVWRRSFCFCSLVFGMIYTSFRVEWKGVCMWCIEGRVVSYSKMER